MRLRVTWEGGGWESDHFEPSDSWLEEESAELVAALEAAGDPIVSVELGGGDALVTRAWNSVLEGAGYDPDGEWTAEHADPLLRFAYYLYRSTGCELSVMDFAAMSFNEDLDCDPGELPDRLQEIVERSDPEYGTVYIAVENEDLDEAYWELFQKMALHDTPGWLDRCIDRDKAIALLKDWQCRPLQSGGKWYVAQDRWDMYDN